MTFDEEIKLIKNTYIGDGIGVQKLGEPQITTVLGSKESVGRTEFYNAATSGMKPEIVFVIHPYEYDDQREVEYMDKRYKVLKTYERNFEELELTLERVIGNVKN